MANTSGSRPALFRNVLMTCGIIAGPFFVFLFLIEGAIRGGYDPLRFAVSSLSIGEGGWLQVANFLATGLLVVAFAVGLRRQPKTSPPSVWGPALIGLTGVGLIGAGIFVSDPLFGYPAELPLRVAQFTFHGHLHDLFSVFFFAGLPGACLVFARRFARVGDRKWSAYSTSTAIAMIVVFVLTAIGFKQTAGFIEVAGLLQRITIIIGFTWLTLFAASKPASRESGYDGSARSTPGRQ